MTSYERSLKVKTNPEICRDGAHRTTDTDKQVFLIRATSMLIQKSYDAPNHIKIPISSISKFDENLPFQAKNHQFQNICTQKIAFLAENCHFYVEIRRKINVSGQNFPFFNTNFHFLSKSMLSMSKYDPADHPGVPEPGHDWPLVTKIPNFPIFLLFLCTYAICQSSM